VPIVPAVLTAPTLCVAFIAGLVAAVILTPDATSALRLPLVGFASACVLGALLTALCRSRRGLPLLLALPFLVGFYRGASVDEPRPGWSPPTGRLELQGTVDGPPSVRGSVSLAVFRVDQAPGFPGSPLVQATLPPLTSLEMGDRVLLIGGFTPVDAHSPGGPRLLARGIVATSSFPELVTLADPPDISPVQRLLLAVRNELEHAIERALPQPGAGLATGLLVGTTAGLTDDIRAALIASGTTHLVVVSGYNISLVAAALVTLLRRRRWLRLAMPLIGIWAFALISGASPPALRASVMASTALLAMRSGRGADPLAALVIAVAVMLGLTPSLAMDLGFQLSALATVGLITLQPRIASTLPMLPEWVREPLAATVAAQLAAWPVLASAFHQISAIAPLSNLLAAPSVPVITILAAATAPLVWLFPPLAPLAGLVLAAPTSYLLWVIEVTSQWAGALVNVPAASTPLLLLYGLALLAWALLPTPEGRDVLGALRRQTQARPLLLWSLIAFPLGGVAGSAAFSGMLDHQTDLTLSLFDAGGAPAIFGRSRSGRSLLIDGGRSPATMANELGQRARLAETHLGLAILTAADADRLPGMVTAVERLPPEMAIAPAGARRDALHERWRSAARGQLVEVTEPIDIRLDSDLEIQIAPLPPLASPNAPTQPIPTLAVRIVFRDSSVLFAPLATANALRGISGSLPLQSNVLIVPRGAARDSLDADLLARVAPNVVLVPNLGGPRGEQSDLRVLALLGQIPLFQSKQHGSLEIRSDGQGVWVIPERP
jgi:competence protein ComEC